jgi:hypothetical protein
MIFPDLTGDAISKNRKRLMGTWTGLFGVVNAESPSRRLSRGTPAYIRVFHTGEIPKGVTRDGPMEGDSSISICSNHEQADGDVVVVCRVVGGVGS